MKPGMLWTVVALEMGDVSHGSSGRELLIGPTLGVMGGRLKESTGVSWSFMELASIFSCLLHLARRFWNQTCKVRAKVSSACPAGPLQCPFMLCPLQGAPCLCLRQGALFCSISWGVPHRECSR